jgi:hypothetical protein
MFKINDKQVINFERDLKAFAHRAFPFATKNTLNQAAFHAQKLAKRDVQVKMILRNKFTLQSIRVDQAKSLVVRDQESAMGSTLDYMVDQEFGAMKFKKGSKGVVIPTGFSAGQEGQQPRTRLPRARNKMKNIKLSKRRTAKNQKQSMIFAVQDAVTSGDKYVFIDLGKRQGIFKVVGGDKNFKRGWPDGAKIKMVHDMSRDSVRIPRNPWLKPAVDTTVVKMPEFYRSSLVFQLKKQGLFK